MKLDIANESEAIVSDLLKHDCTNLSDDTQASVLKAISSKRKPQMVYFDSSQATKKKLPVHKKSLERSEISSNYDREDGSLFNRSFSTSI